MAATVATSPILHDGSNTNGNDDDGTQLTYNETIDALCGFVKTAAHTILCHRQVYPPNVFTRRQRYRVPVWASRHPGLTAYIDELIDAVKVQLQQNLVRSVHLVITSVSSGAILERYRFDVDFILSSIPMRDRDFSIPGNMTSQTMELQLRSFMMKLVSLDGALYDMDDPDDLTWALVLDMKEGCEPQSGQAKGLEPSQGAWVPFNEPGTSRAKGTAGIVAASEAIDSSGDRPAYLRARPQLSSVGSGADDEQDDAQIVPIKSLDTGVINLMLYVEEHPSAKRRSKRGPSSGATTSGKHKATTSAARSRLPKRATVVDERHEEALRESMLAGERDIDQPLQHASSSGAATRGAGGRRRRKTKEGGAEESVSASESSAGEGSDSGDSIRSVNDFAGYGKGPGTVGMSGMGM